MFRRILIWFSGILLISFVAYLATSYWLNARSPYRDDFGRRMVEFQTSEAETALQRGGVPALKDYLHRVDMSFRGNHYLVDQQGRDVATGEDRSAILQRAKHGPRFRWPPPSHIAFKNASADGRYFLVVDFEFHPDPLRDIAVYGWIVGLIVLLCYALAWTLARPIRALRETVVRFGRGDLGSRTHSRRRDELGELARAFDQMAERIETLLTAERRLLQDISHELRSPLARLRFAVELARNGSATPAAFARITKEVDRLATMVDELLQVTRAEGDPESRNVAVIDLAQFLENLAEDCRIEATARGCSLETRVNERVSWSGDRELLHRAVENVVRNAIRYTEPGSAVTIELSREPGWVVVRVRDHGPGVPEEDLAQIFRPFYRVAEDRSRDNGGVGLGLAIANRAVRVHHGQIDARNLHPGLQVELRLPA